MKCNNDSNCSKGELFKLVLALLSNSCKECFSPINDLQFALLLTILQCSVMKISRGGPTAQNLYVNQLVNGGLLVCSVCISTYSTKGSFLQQLSNIAVYSIE